MSWLKPYYEFSLIAQSSKIKVVSVDVFDTLLLRTTTPEFTKFRKFGDEISKRVPFVLDSIEKQSLYFMKLRILAAKTVYHQKKPIKGGREARLSEIYDLMIIALKLQFDLSEKQINDIRKLLYEIEIECELLDLSVNTTLVEILKEIKNQDKKIIAISDMYLSVEDIKLLLKANETYDLFDQIIVSSEFGYGKASGVLFDDVLDMQAIEPYQMCHLGDNYRSDYLQPTAKGIRAIYSPRSLTWQRVASLRKWINYKFVYKLDFV